MEEQRLTPLQRSNYFKLVEALGYAKLTDKENKTLIYLSMDAESTIANLCSAIKKARGIQ